MYPLVYVVNKIFVITHLRNVLYVIIVCKYVQTLNITFSDIFFANDSRPAISRGRNISHF